MDSKAPVIAALRELDNIEADMAHWASSVRSKLNEKLSKESVPGAVADAGELNNLLSRLRQFGETVGCYSHAMQNIEDRIFEPSTYTNATSLLVH